MQRQKGSDDRQQTHAQACQVLDKLLEAELRGQDSQGPVLPVPAKGLIFSEPTGTLMPMVSNGRADTWQYEIHTESSLMKAWQ